MSYPEELSEADFRFIQEFLHGRVGKHFIMRHDTKDFNSRQLIIKWSPSKTLRTKNKFSFKCLLNNFL